MSTIEIHRRVFLAGVGAATVTGLAGCTGTGPTADEQVGEADDTTTPTATETHDEDGHSEEEDHSGEETAADDHHEPEVHHEEEDTHSEGGHGTEGPAPHVEVLMQSLDTGEHFHPHVAWVEVGGTATFVNESGMHTATAYHSDNGKPSRIPEGAASFDSGLLTEDGATFEHTFEQAGVYDIYCAPHEELGMIGSILVGRPDPHGQPGLAAPQSDMSERVASKIAMLNEQVNTMLGHEH
ncbi:plastocyanin/azurin family copper-binding protein [Haloferax sp. S1W]|uniref:cupredoxin domain-containing protein n=1 Tax=Haloferax sp. S1W TaxID=3377110 RepID=UPI0037C77AD0